MVQRHENKWIILEIGYKDTKENDFYPEEILERLVEVLKKEYIHVKSPHGDVG